MEEGFGWVEDPAVAPHRVLRVGSGKLPEFEDAALVDVDGRPALVVTRLGAGNAEIVGALDLATGEHRPDHSGLHYSSPRTMRLGAGRLLATGGPGDVVTVRDAATGVPIRTITGPDTGTFAFGTVDRRDVLYLYGDGLTVLDLVTGETIVRHSELGGDYYFRGFLAEHRDRMLITGQGSDGTVIFHDALTREPVGAPFRTPDGRQPDRITAVTYEGRLIVATRGHNWSSDPIVLWDAETATEVLTPPPADDVEWFSLALVDGRPLLLLGRKAATGRPLTFWDPVAGREVLAGFFEGYDQSVEHVSLGSIGDGFFAVVAGDYREDGRVELWTATADGRRRTELAARPTRDITLGTVDGRPTVVLGDEHGVLRLFDVATAGEFDSPFYGGPIRDKYVTGGVIAGRGVAVLAGSPSRVWDLAAGLPVARLDRFTQFDQGFAVGELGQRPVIVVVQREAVTIWDLDAAAAVGEIPGSFEPEAGVVLTEIAGRAAVVAVAGLPPVRNSFVQAGANGTEHNSFVQSGTTEARAETERNSFVHPGANETPTETERNSFVHPGANGVRAWDAATGAPLGSPYPLDSRGEALVAGRLNDRTVVYAGCGDGTVRVVDPLTGQDALPPLTGHNEAVRVLALRDGVLASGGDDNTVRVWDATTGSAVGEPFNGHGYEITSVHLAEWQGEPVVVSTARVGAPRMWMLSAEPVDAGHTGSVDDLAGGHWGGVPAFASASADRTVRLWDAATGRPIGAPLAGHEAEVVAVAFAGDGLITGDRGGVVLRWRPHPDGPRAEPLGRLASGVRAIASAEVDGRTVVGAAAEDGTFDIWDAGTGEPYATVHANGIRDADLGTAGGRLLAVTVGPNEWPEGIVTVWDVRSGEPVYEPVPVPEESDGFVTFGVTDGRLVVVQGIDGLEDEDEGYHPEDASNVYVYDATTRTVLARMDNHWHFNQAATVAGPSAALIATDGGVIVMDPRTGEQTATYTGHAADVTCVAAVEVAGRTVVASGDLGNGVHIWDLETRERRG
ncbi:WD40 repeat domain-containing protein [Actinoplanes sp. NPDC049265]|uniref:WD40 repeat domain-containing protein n=1 Tax=Actinoplanes sp. NPDC049265 TaxID=3363902 RepID=UPI003714B022